MTVVNSLLNERESPRVAMVSIRPIEPLTVKVFFRAALAWSIASVSSS